MVLERIKEMLADSRGISPDDIKEESTFADLDLDSLDMAEMLMNIEDEFGVTLDADQNISTVGEFAEKVESLRQS